MNKNMSYYDFKKSVKRGLIYLLIAIPFMLVVSVVLTIVKVPYWLTMLSTIVVGGIVIFVSFVINGKIDEKRKVKENDKFDPFRD